MELNEPCQPKHGDKSERFLTLMETNKIFPLPPLLAVPSTGAMPLLSVLKAFPSPGLIVSSLRHHHLGMDKNNLLLY
ncbi:hypothetical protein TNCV_99651 [Trichonephila clavipes]|nr:hypothetical protein TNCV_99651 [Trichonephila clavipes]